MCLSQMTHGSDLGRKGDSSRGPWLPGPAPSFPAPAFPSRKLFQSRAGIWRTIKEGISQLPRELCQDLKCPVGALLQAGFIPPGVVSICFCTGQVILRKHSTEKVCLPSKAAILADLGTWTAPLSKSPAVPWHVRGTTTGDLISEVISLELRDTAPWEPQTTLFQMFVQFSTKTKPDSS